ncbi:MAG: hypothetical protein HGA66_10775 [Holophaga sp.]|nr:hypothetical protein [Holophaga sp.]
MKFHSKGWILAGAILAALALACGGRHHSAEGSLRVFNDGAVTMSQLYVTPSTSDTWGFDQLAPYPLQPAGSITLTRLYPGYYDVRARFNDGSTDTVYDVRIHDGEITTLGMQNSGNGAVAVFNNSGLTITGVYLTPVSSSTWGPNQTDLPLASGQSLTLTGVAPDVYALRVVYSTAATRDFEGFTVTAGTTYTIQVN